MPDNEENEMDDDETPGNPMHLIFGGPPPEVREALKSQFDRQLMASEVFRHGLRTMFTEIDVEHLHTLAQMLGRIADAPNPAQIANYWQGMADAILDIKHEVCIGCGKNHAEEFALQAQEIIPPEETS